MSSVAVFSKYWPRIPRPW